MSQSLPFSEGHSSSALRSPQSLSGVLSNNAGKPMLAVYPADDAAIDYIGRWDSSKTARWCAGADSLMGSKFWTD